MTPYFHCSTSTFDGCAIAYAVTKHLTAVTRCRTMFATHYHALCEDFEGDPAVALAHMVSAGCRHRGQQAEITVDSTPRK